MDEDIKNVDIMQMQMQIIEQLLERIDNSREDDFLKEVRKIYQYSEDYNNSRGSERVTHMMFAPKKEQTNTKDIRDEGLKEIRTFTQGAEELIIIDPYIFGGAADSASEYIKDFKKSSRIDNKQVKKIHLIYNSTCGNTGKIKNGIKKLASDNNCSITNCDTKKIHDRIWIKDKTEAIVVGTSLGGIGNKLCFILDLPKEDLANLLKYLKDNNCFENNFN